MLGVSRKSDYSVRILLHLACLGPEGHDTIAAITRRRRLPAPFVRRLIAPLIKAGLLASIRGSGGGLRLGRPAGDISLLDVVQAVDGGITFNHCLKAGHSCPLASGCPVQSAWMTAGEVLASHLASIRLESLATRTPGHDDAHRRTAALPPSHP